MKNIQSSLLAIQQYNPKDHVYLRVVGEGNNQYLKAEKISWFGRILMWFGCTSANMGKVAKFIHSNIDTFCKAGIIDLKNKDNALAGLIKRISKYALGHPKRIKHEAIAIQNIYTRAVINALQPYTPPPAAPLNTNALVTLNPTPVTTVATPLAAFTNATTLSTIATLKTNATVVLNPNPVTSVATPPAVVPPIPLAGQKCIAKLNRAYSDIAKVEDYMLGRLSDAPTKAEIANAASAMKNIKELLEENGENKKVLKTLIAAMSLPMIETLIRFPCSIESPICDYPELDVDVFYIYNFGAQQHSFAILDCMSIDQLELIAKYLKKYDEDTFNKLQAKSLERKSFKPCDKNSFKTLASHICGLNNSPEKTRIMTALLKDSDFEIATINHWNPGKPYNEYNDSVNKELAFYYFLNLITDLSIVDREAKINTFLEKIQWNPNIAYKRASPFESQELMSRWPDSLKTNLLQTCLQSAPTAKQLFNSSFIKEILIDPANYEGVFLQFMDRSTIPPFTQSEFCRAMLDLYPGSDKTLINNFLKNSDSDNIFKYLIMTLPHPQSILEDATFVNKLSLANRNGFGIAILHAFEADQWASFQILQKICSDFTGLSTLFGECNKLPQKKASRFYTIYEECRKRFAAEELAKNKMKMTKLRTLRSSTTYINAPKAVQEQMERDALK